MRTIAICDLIWWPIDPRITRSCRGCLPTSFVTRTTSTPQASGGPATPSRIASASEIHLGDPTYSLRNSCAEWCLWRTEVHLLHPGDEKRPLLLLCRVLETLLAARQVRPRNLADPLRSDAAPEPPLPATVGSSQRQVRFVPPLPHQSLSGREACQAAPTCDRTWAVREHSHEVQGRFDARPRARAYYRRPLEPNWQISGGFPWRQRRPVDYANGNGDEQGRAGARSTRGTLLRPLTEIGKVSRKTRGEKDKGSERLGQLVDLFGVEHLIVALEEAGDGGAVDLHFQVADA